MVDNQTQEKPKREPYYVEFANKVIAHLEAGTAPWQRPWEPGKTLMAPHNPASGTVYRGMNRVSLAMSGYEDPRWMTLKQANEQGMSIIPGSKSTPIVFFQFTKEEEIVGENGKPVLGEDGKPETQTVKLDSPIVRFARVFNAEQIDGMPPLELTGKAYEWEPAEKAEKILSASGANINHDQSNRAYYRPKTDSIHLPPRENFPTSEQYYGTALHELGHWTGHSSRLNRDSGPFGSESYACEELRAEISSWMLGQDTGIPHDPGQHAAYVQSWVKALKDKPFEIVQACRDAEFIKEYLLGLEMKKEVVMEQPEKAHTKGQIEDVAAMGVPSIPATEKTFLSVPYREKEQAKKHGAKWDAENKLWFAPQGADLNALAKWVPENVKAPEPVRTLAPQEEFAQALQAAGLDLRGKTPVMDGHIHRVPLADRPHGLDGAYCGYLDGRPNGWAQNYVTGERAKWVATGHALSDEQKAALQVEAVQKQEARKQEIQARQNEAAREAHTEWVAYDFAQETNPYLAKKGVLPFGIREDIDGNLLIPVMNADKDLRGLQRITPDGQKRFQPGIEKQGNFFLIPPSQHAQDMRPGEIILSEGYATGASLHMATGKPVAVAFDAGNLEPVAKALRAKFPNAAITICADNDHQKQRNIGVEMAEKAAKAVGGKVKVPIFNEEEKARGLKDFNDLHQSRGLAEVAKQAGLGKEHKKDRERESHNERGMTL